MALFAVVLGLGAWVYYKPDARDANTHALSTLKPQDVKRIRIERPDAPAPSPAAQRRSVIALERQEQEWRMTAPIAARAETFQVERLLSILDARSAVRYPAGELERFGLDKPHASLALEDQTLTYGAINTTTREQYVLTRAHVYLVPLAHTTALPRDADALLARALLSASEMPVRFELPDFSVALRDGTWIVNPAANDASADDRHAWVDAWRHASALRAVRHDGRAAAAEIKLELKDGKAIALGVLQREPELVLLRRDEGVQYHFVAESAKRLLSPPGGAVKQEAK